MWVHLDREEAPVSILRAGSGVVGCTAPVGMHECQMGCRLGWARLQQRLACAINGDLGQAYWRLLGVSLTRQTAASTGMHLNLVCGELDGLGHKNH